MGRRRAGESGFTLAELVTVMILVGILSAVAIPRFMDRTLDERGLHDAVKAAVQHARHAAVAARRFTCVNVTPGSGAAGVVAVVRDTAEPENVATVGCTPGCTAGPNCTALPLPAPGRGCDAAHQVCAPGGVAIESGDSFIFDPLGRVVNASKAVQAAPSSISISNQAAISVQPETGYVQ